MARTVVWARRARSDLRLAISYIQTDSPDAAHSFATAIVQASRSLSTLAERGRVVPELGQEEVRELLSRFAADARCSAVCEDSRMMLSVFVGTSVDGFIARPNGDLDFLPAGGGEPHGYDEFIASVDAIVIGRKTFETVLTFGAWPYGAKRVVVLSSRPLDLSKARGGVIEQMGGPPAGIVSRLAASGAHHLYVDGGITIQRFLRAGLIDRLVITRVPVLIGDGIPLFGSLPSDVRLHHVLTRSYQTGLVQSEYHRAAS